MRRSPPPFHLFASAAASSTASTATTMSSRPSFRGGRSWGRGQNRGRRSFSDRPLGGGVDYDQQFVSGDSHLQQVRDANRGFRPQFNGGSFRGFPHSPYSHPRTPYNNPSRPSPPRQQAFDQNQQFYRPPYPPRFDSNQQFRPRWQQQQQLRPRPPKALEYRNWEYASPGPSPECERFTILSYNILADYLVKDHWNKLYFHIPRHILDWERRKRSILFELGLWIRTQVNKDVKIAPSEIGHILLRDSLEECLEYLNLELELVDKAKEVDRFQDLKEELELRGYSGIWKMRTGDPVDGCAIFWLNSRFKLLHEESLEFCKLGLRDNVAQICVFESLVNSKSTDTSVLSSSLVHGNMLVVCNIHVLFNPKRGEIKLGQIRVLLHRAHAISKLWNDAPIIFCGDFNCTPKSPLYNFIAEQKLDLSELPRDKISGQESAEIHLSRPFNSRSGAPCADNSRQVLPGSDNMKAIHCNSLLDMQNRESPDNKSGNGHFPVSLPQSQCSVVKSVESCINRNDSEGRNDRPLGESDFPLMDECNNKSKSSNCISQDALEGSPSGQTESNVGNSPSNCISNRECCEISISDVLPTEPFGPPQTPNSSEVTQESSDNLLSPSAAHEKGFLLDEKFESLSLNDYGQELDEMMNTPAVEKLKYDPIAWTPFEIETATGCPDCTVMEHPIKLKSVYGEVQNYSGTRDSTGEPAVTSYHKRFLGTVDYIWHSEGLQTARVLAPIPKDVMLWTRGFPTKKWGSDHIALVSELAFKKDTCNEKTEIQLQQGPV